ncbi:MAG TPA: hypothetical protein VE757_08910 [Gaiellaceae bacterium]|nr:hypothetical protein [Gaiellaceae bacterium]
MSTTAMFAGTKRVQIPCQKATYVVALARECPRLVTNTDLAVADPARRPTTRG